MASGRFESRECPALLYVSDRRDGHTTGYGAAVVTLKLPAALLSLEDEFGDGERHYTIPIDRIKRSHIVS